MTSFRQKLLPSSSSKAEFVDKDREEKSRSKHRFLRSALVLGLSLAAVGLIVLIIVVRSPPNSSSKRSEKDKEEKHCSFSGEAKHIGLERFLQRLQTAFFKHHPHLIAMKPGVTSTEVRQIYRPYDFRPEAMKNTTDAGVLLYHDVKAIFRDVDEKKLSLRERKSLHVAKGILKVTFGWSPFEQNYYSGDWLLGPNIFCWQPVCDLLTHLENSLPHFKPANLSDLSALQQLLKKHNSSFRQYKENLEQAPKIGMVRSAEACRVGVREFKRRFLPIAESKETGILQTEVAMKMLSKEFLVNLNLDVRQAWKEMYGQTVEESIRNDLIKDLGKPISNLISFLETEYIRHCVPDNVSCGLSSLPLPHVYVDGMEQSDLQTTQELPSGHKLNGTTAYLKQMSVFTTVDISPPELKKIAQERLDALLLQATLLAQRYTGQNDHSTAVTQFRGVLKSRDMFYNKQYFPATESDEAAFLRCTTKKSSREFCPTRWRAMQAWIEHTEEVMNLIRPKLSGLFYTDGPKKTIPGCSIKVAPWFHSEAVYHSYRESASASCNTNPSLQLLPFFVNNYGPKFTEWTTTAHEQLPGHHLEVRSYTENFHCNCNDVISWLSRPNYFPGFTEGWATYVEYPLLAKDTDIYSDTNNKKVLLQKYGMLRYQILASLRTLLDIDINYYNMSRKEALLLYEKYSWETGDQASKDITRFQSCPGAVTSYMIGQMTFVRARRLMEESLGSRFSLPEFHYQVLRQGEIPLEYLLKYIQDISDR